MTTLVISTPWFKKDQNGFSVGKPGQKHSWETYFNTGKAIGYILYPSEFENLHQGIAANSCKLVMLRNDYKKRRAEARLTNLRKTLRNAGNGQWRYDVYFDSQNEVKPYVYNLPREKLKRNGVKVF